MNRLSFLLFILFCFIMNGSVFGQSTDTITSAGNEIIGKQVESIAEHSDIELDYSDWAE